MIKVALKYGAWLFMPAIFAIVAYIYEGYPEDWNWNKVIAVSGLWFFYALAVAVQSIMLDLKIIGYPEEWRD